MELTVDYQNRDGSGQDIQVKEEVISEQLWSWCLDRLNVGYANQKRVIVPTWLQVQPTLRAILHKSVSTIGQNSLFCRKIKICKCAPSAHSCLASHHAYPWLFLRKSSRTLDPGCLFFCASPLLLIEPGQTAIIVGIIYNLCRNVALFSFQ